MTIRRANVNDISRIGELLRQIGALHHETRPDLFRADACKYGDDELSSMIEDDDRPVFVAVDESDGIVVGYAFCIIEQYCGDGARTDMKMLYIDDLCVDELRRGCGIGTALFDFVIDYARQIGCYNVTLNVWHGNDGAECFYERCGMKPMKTYLEKILD